jgi:hypothetical protein
MKVSYAEYQKYQKKLSGLRNRIPSYVPTPEDVERMIEYTKKPRKYLQNVPVSSGRKYEYESKIKFVKGGRIGESCITEEDMCMYLLFLLKTAKPKDQKGIENLEYIDKRLKEMLIIKSPDEVEGKEQ